MSRIAWFNCFAGVAGDMALGALIDAGADVDKVAAMLDTLGVPGWQLTTERVDREGITATKAHVRVTDDATSRNYSEIRDLLKSSALPERVRSRALAVFTRLGEVEAGIHGSTLEGVHFHEVGGHDAIVDIVGTCAALEVLDVEAVACSSIAQGTGTIRAAHGVMANPAPATTGLLHGVPIHGVEQPFELTTPTGAALMAVLTTAHGPMPPMTVVASGFGAGTRQLTGMANCTQVVLGEAAENGQQAVVVETNVDDVSGEVIAFTVERALGAGADDVWVTPIHMKKGRPAHTVSVLTRPGRREEMAAILVNELGTFGTRSYGVQKDPVDRTFQVVMAGDEQLSVKVGAHRSKVEYDDASAVARKTGQPLRKVLEDAQNRHRE